MIKVIESTKKILKCRCCGKHLLYDEIYDVKEDPRMDVYQKFVECPECGYQTKVDRFGK